MTKRQAFLDWWDEVWSLALVIFFALLTTAAAMGTILIAALVFLHSPLWLIALPFAIILVAIFMRLLQHFAYRDMGWK